MMVIVTEYLLIQLKDKCRPYELTALRFNNGRIEGYNNQRIFHEHEISRDALIAAAPTKSEARQLRSIINTYINKDNRERIKLYDLSNIEQNEHINKILEYASSEIINKYKTQLNHCEEILRNLIIMRKAHEDMQGKFLACENFIIENNLAKRTEKIHLSPRNDGSKIDIRENQKLTQRLPVSSMGLSDIIIYLNYNEIDDNSMLEASLELLEMDNFRAEWLIPLKTVKANYIRLTLTEALDHRKSTPMLSLIIKGAGKVSVKTSIFHPDGRYHPRVEGIKYEQVIAVKCMKYLPGIEVPPALDSIIPKLKNKCKINKYIIDEELFSNAENITKESLYNKYLPEEQAIQVHPVNEGVSAMFIPMAVPIGCIQIDARIRLVPESEQNVKYAIGTYNRYDKRHNRSESEIGSSQLSQWRTLSPSEEGTLSLVLESPIEHLSDLYLFTELETQPSNPKNCWALFDRITAIIN